MSTPLRRRAVAAFAALATVLVGLVATQPADAASASAVTFSKSRLSPSTDLANPHRGQYRWLGSAPSPSTWPARDIYYRDQVYWGRLEPSKGVYDFTWIEDGLRRAGETKGKFGFRVMAYCPGCWMNSRADFPKVTPSYLPLQSGHRHPGLEQRDLPVVVGAAHGRPRREVRQRQAARLRRRGWLRQVRRVVGRLPHEEDHRRQRPADGRGRQQGLPDQDHPVQHDDLGRPHPQGARDEPADGAAHRQPRGAQHELDARRGHPAAVDVEDPADLHRVGQQRRARPRSRPGEEVPPVDAVEREPAPHVRRDDGDPEVRLPGRHPLVRVPLLPEQGDGRGDPPRQDPPRHRDDVQPRRRPDLRRLVGAALAHGLLGQEGVGQGPGRRPAQDPARHEDAPRPTSRSRRRCRRGRTRRPSPSWTSSATPPPCTSSNYTRRADGSYTLGSVVVS